jgi:hypothetical protein
MKQVILSKSNSKGKKYKVIITDGIKQRTIHFGASGYEDYTMHKDKERMKNYLSRHQKTENWDDIFTAGWWSRWLLWSEPNMKDAIDLVKRKLKNYEFIVNI